MNVLCSTMSDIGLNDFQKINLAVPTYIFEIKYNN
jgi:hypothetical protein